MRSEHGRALLIPNSEKWRPSGLHPQSNIFPSTLHPIIYQFLSILPSPCKVRILSLHPFTIWDLMQGPIIWLDELTYLELRDFLKILISFFPEENSFVPLPKVRCFLVPCKALLCYEDPGIFLAVQPSIVWMQSEVNAPIVSPLHSSNNSNGYWNRVWSHLDTSPNS